MIIGVQFFYSVVMGGTVLGAQQTISANDLFSQTNVQRLQHQLPALTLDDRLSQAAFLKAKDMFRQQYWAHTAPDGTTPWHWFGVVGYNYTYAGENLAKDFMSAGAVTAAWMASPDHRANILDKDYSQVGFAVVDGTLSGQPTTLVVALYGKPVTSLAGVAASQSPQETVSAMEQPVTLWTRLVIAASAFTPVALVALIILTITSGVASVAHFYRNKLPKQLRQSWYRHHGLYKFIGTLSMIIIVISLYGSGQI
jgi:hypothetical protein